MYIDHSFCGELLFKYYCRLWVKEKQWNEVTNSKQGIKIHIILRLNPTTSYKPDDITRFLGPQVQCAREDAGLGDLPGESDAVQMAQCDLSPAEQTHPGALAGGGGQDRP